MHINTSAIKEFVVVNHEATSFLILDEKGKEAFKGLLITWIVISLEKELQPVLTLQQ